MGPDSFARSECGSPDSTKHIAAATLPRVTAVASLLADARARAGLSQRGLASRSGIPQASVSRIERRHILPRADTVERWLSACGMSLETRPIPGGGVDRTLIRARLAMTPLERSRLGVQEARAMLALQRGRLRDRQP